MLMSAEIAPSALTLPQPAPPRVSIVTAAFNAAATIDQTIASVLAQTEPDWELIVVDDGSTDDTFARAQAFAARDPRIRVIGKVNGGISAARNSALREARGAWIYFLDSDDWLKPDGLQAMLAGAADADVLIAAHERVTAEGAAAGVHHPPEIADPLAVFARGCPIVPVSVLVRAELVHRLGGFDEALQVSEDWDLWRRAARLGARFRRLDQIVAVYRLQQNSLSRRADRLAIDGARVIAEAFSGPDPAGDPGEADDASAHYALYLASVAAGGGADPAPILAHIPDAARWSFDPGPWGRVIVEACAYAMAIDPRAIAAHWTQAGPRIEQVLAALDARLGRSRQVDLLRLHALAHVFGVDAQAPDLEFARFAVIDVARPPNLLKPDGRDVVVAAIAARGRFLGVIEGLASDFADVTALRARLRAAAPRLAGRAAVRGLAGPGLALAALREAISPTTWRLVARERGKAAAIATFARRAAARVLAHTRPSAPGALALALVRDPATTAEDIRTRIAALKAAGAVIASAPDLAAAAAEGRLLPMRPHIAFLVDVGALGERHPALDALPRGAVAFVRPGVQHAGARRDLQARGFSLGVRQPGARGLARQSNAAAAAVLSDARGEVVDPSPGVLFAAGDVDETLRRLAQRAGFAFGVNPEPAPAHLDQDPMTWRRLELRPRESVGEFVRKMGGVR